MTTATKDPKVKVYLTEIGTMLDGTPIVVGWDFCKCGYHVSICKCAGGPTEPLYVTKLREPGKAEAVLAPTAVSSSAAAAPAASSAGGGTATGKAKGPKLPTCTGCGKPVTDDDADKQDDGTWLCFTCQEAS